MDKQKLKPCPFHNSDTCGCYDSVDIPDRDWQSRPIEDALLAQVAALEEAGDDMLRLVERFTDNRAFINAAQAWRKLREAPHA